MKFTSLVRLFALLAILAIGCWGCETGTDPNDDDDASGDDDDATDDDDDDTAGDDDDDDTAAPCTPVCLYPGSYSEGWYDSCTNNLYCYASCDGSTLACLHDGSYSEGWYADPLSAGCDANSGLINFEDCM